MHVAEKQESQRTKAHMPASKVPEGHKACPAPVHLHITDSVDLRKRIYTSLLWLRQ